MPCETRKGKNVLLHLMLESYVADILKAKIGSEFNEGLERRLYAPFVNRKSMNSHVIESPLEEICQKRNLFHLTFLARRNALQRGIRLLMSMPSMLRVLHTFPFIEVHKSVNIYSNFRFELMHTFFFGICRPLKECLFNYLDDCERVSNTMPPKMSI